MGLFQGTTVPLLSKSLNQTALKQQVISQNIANVDTPNYKAKHVEFRDALKAGIQAHRTQTEHVPFDGTGNSRVVNNQQTTIQNNGNNVDVDREMTRLAKSQTEYQAFVNAMNHDFRTLKAVVKGVQ
ncbi:flagellar basal body rod protein FlgB [Tuberibacillus sp. Marseille-P3662]|uniref:flagellar basal body rod protein FlgB n=1 Tax=Tuberibacillus sp. Marseille-P3662 TaxID=1965358 RepID=UPI001592E82D|nr:flagellar basal body rod protein FlgB [Tuberibacillus sp. Marseille-P3662]